MIPIADDDGKFFIVLVVLDGRMHDNRRSKTVDVLTLHRNMVSMQYFHILECRPRSENGPSMFPID